MLTTTGAAHFLRPQVFDPLVPRRLGDARAWVLGSGAAELAVAAAVAAPRTRRLGASAAALLFAGVFPGNVQMALDARRSPSAAYRAVAYGRLPLQVPLVLWALRVRRTTR
ncbi:MAG: DoxX family protein [Motilibacteraceae bacterium]